MILLFLLFFARDISSNILASRKENNLFVYNLFSFVELAALALIFYSNAKIHSVKYRQIIGWGLVIALLTDVVFYT